MATGHIILSTSNANLPSASACSQEIVFGTNFTFTQLNFDGATDEKAFWHFRMPSDYSSSPVVKIQWKSSGTSSADVVWATQLNAYTPGSDTANYETDTLATADTATTADSTSAHVIVETSISISNTDSLSAGDAVVLLLFRDADNASDTLNSIDAEVVNVMLQYTTT